MDAQTRWDTFFLQTRPDAFRRKVRVKPKRFEEEKEKIHTMLFEALSNQDAFIWEELSNIRRRTEKTGFLTAFPNCIHFELFTID